MNNPALPQTNPYRILVLEDDSTVLASITAALEKAGFSAITAHSVEQAFTITFPDDLVELFTTHTIETALRHLRELETISAIWLEHDLPGEEDGLDFIVKFKANGGKWSRVPIFVVSDAISPSLIRTYRALGVHHIFHKHLHEFDDIITKITTVLHGSDLVTP